MAEREGQGREALVGWFHRELPRDLHQYNVIPTCEKWADQLIRTFLKAHDAEVAAAAWDEGYETGWSDHHDMRGDDPTPNPYRADESNPTEGERT